MSDCLCSAKRMSQSFVGFAAPDAVNGRFKTSHLWALQNQPPVSGVRVPILTLPTFVSCSKHQEPTRLSFPARGEGLTSAHHPGRRSLPRVRIAPRSPQASPSSGPSEPGGAWLVLNPRAVWRTIRSTLETTTVLTVPAKMEVCKEPDHVGLGHLAHGVAGQPLQGEQPGGQLVRRQPIARPAAQLLQRERLPRRQHQGGADALAPLRVGQAHHRHFPDRRVFPNRLLDLQGGDLYPLADAGPFADKPDSFENTASICAGSGLRELLLFSCHSLFITNHVLSSMT